MKHWMGKILNHSYADHKELKDIEITDKPLVVLCYGKSIVRNEPDYRVNRPNGRKDYQFMYIKDGKCCIKVGDTNKIYSANTLFLIKPRTPQNRYGLSDNNIFTQLYIHFSGNKVEELLDRYNINTTIFQFEENFDAFEDIVNRMEAGKSGSHHEDFCNILLEELFILISNKSKNSAVKKFGFNELLEIMDETCTENYPIKFYAEQIHFSEEYFVRFFKKAMGVSPHKYIMTLRLQKAISMLIYTNYPIKTISQKLGFSNQHYFSKVFCDNYKVSPSKFRSLEKNKK